jgi:hypothetical protein
VDGTDGGIDEVERELPPIIDGIRVEVFPPPMTQKHSKRSEVHRGRVLPADPPGGSALDRKIACSRSCVVRVPLREFRAA